MRHGVPPANNGGLTRLSSTLSLMAGPGRPPVLPVLCVLCMCGPAAPALPLPSCMCDLLPLPALPLPCPQAKANIMVVRDIERDQIEFLSKTLGCLPVAHIDHLKPEKLGQADLVEEMEVGKRGGEGAGNVQTTFSGNVQHATIFAQ